MISSIEDIAVYDTVQPFTCSGIPESKYNQSLLLLQYLGQNMVCVRLHAWAKYSTSYPISFKRLREQVEALRAYYCVTLSYTP